MTDASIALALDDLTQAEADLREAAINVYKQFLGRRVLVDCAIRYAKAQEAYLNALGQNS